MIAKYCLVWFLLAAVAIANGIVRQITYAKVLPELAAHQLSTVTAIVASGAVVWGVSRFWPIEFVGQSFKIGLCWLVLTVLFEFGFGYFVAGHSWQRLLADYNLLEGRIWTLFLVWVAIMPYVFFKLAKR